MSSNAVILAYDSDGLQLIQYRGRLSELIGMTQATKTLWVDGNRTDSYTPNGSVEAPFLHIQDAVNQVVTNGDNATNNYTIQIAAGTYKETVDISNPTLTNLVFVGYNVTIGDIVAQVTPALQCINNDNLTRALFVGISFVILGAGVVVNLSSNTNGTNFGGSLLGGISFYDCYFISQNNFIDLTNIVAVTFDRCMISGNINISNVGETSMQDVVWDTGGAGTILTVAANPKPAGFSASQLLMQSSRVQASITIGSLTDSASSAVALPGSVIRGPIVSFGQYKAYNGTRTSASVDIKNGGTLIWEGGMIDGSITMEAGGTQTFIGTVGTVEFLVNGNFISSGTGSPNGAVTGNPGDLYLNKSGGAATTLWVKESGVATNTGWVGK